MPRLEQWIAALTILQKHYPDADTAAEHDQFWVYGRGIRKETLPEEELRKLDSYGWLWDEKVGGWKRFT